MRKIFSGSSNPTLAKAVARELGEELGQIEVGRFANGEKRILIKEENLGGKAALFQSLSGPTDEMIVEFALLADALARTGVGDLVGVVPWLGYAKQDKVFRKGEPLSVKVVARLLQVAKLSKLITFDLHNRAIVGFFEIPVVELSAKKLLLEYFRRGLRPERSLVVAPDSGSIKASTSFAEELGVQVVYLDKKRDLVTGKVRVRGMTGKVKGKEVLVRDDNIVSGTTLIETAKALKRAGAKRIRMGVTHHLWVPGVQEKLAQSPIDELVVTDTVEVPEEWKRKREKKLKILSVKHLLAESLRREN